jgi:bifunctional DNA-binding transcriptional regulator/antitoxin component of YhaV-PrlF toxin-antitoxin module
METTKPSSKGQVELPKSVRDEHGWTPGTEFDGVFGSVPHAGPKKTLEEMDDGIRAAVARRYRRAANR